MLSSPQYQYAQPDTVAPSALASSAPGSVERGVAHALSVRWVPAGGADNFQEAGAIKPFTAPFLSNI